MTDNDPLADYIPPDELARRRDRRAEIAEREAQRRQHAIDAIAAIRQQLRETR